MCQASQFVLCKPHKSWRRIREIYLPCFITPILFDTIYLMVDFLFCIAEESRNNAFQKINV